jgi:beta-glucosidase
MAIAVGGLSACLQAQCLLSFQVSKATEENWHDTVTVAPGDSVDVRAVVSYTGSEKALGLASLNFQPTVSNWSGEDRLLPLVNGGAGGQDTVPIGAVMDEPGAYGRLVPYAFPGLSKNMCLKGHVDVVGGMTYLRVAQAQATDWCGEGTNVTGGSGVQMRQCSDAGRKPSEPAFSPALKDIVVFKFGVALSVHAEGARTLTVGAPAEGIMRERPGGKPYFGWYAKMSEVSGSIRAEPRVQSATIEVAGPARPARLAQSPEASPPKSSETRMGANNPATKPAPRQEDYCKERHDRFNERARQGHEKGDIDLLFIGDSITEQWEGPGKDVWAKHYASRRAVNLGIGGDMTQHVIWRLLNGNVEGLDKPVPADAKPPHLAVVMIGTNNITTNDTPEQIAAGVKKVVETLRTQLPRTEVLLLAIFPRTAKPDDPLRLKVAETNKILKPAAEVMTGVHYLDIGDRFLDKDGTLSKEVMPDELHLSQKGYEIWAQAIEPKVHELLGEK